MGVSSTQPHHWDFNRVVCDMESSCASQIAEYTETFREKGEMQERWGVPCSDSYDATPSQLSDPDLPRFLATYVPCALVPEVRFVAILRE